MSLGYKLGLDKMLVIKFKPVSILLNMSYKVSLKNLYLYFYNVRQFWFKSDGIKYFFTMNPMEDLLEKITRHQIISHIWLIIKHFCVNMRNCTH